MPHIANVTPTIPSFRLTKFMNRICLALSLILPLFASAEIVPVPKEVIPKKILGAKPRNVVFILSDDHRYDAMSFMGHPFAITPHMDAMAKEGVI